MFYIWWFWVIGSLGKCVNKDFEILFRFSEKECYNWLLMFFKEGKVIDII